MESLFTEAESATNQRRSSFSSSTLTNNYYRNFYWGLGFKSSSQNAYNYSLHPSNTMAGASFRGEIGYLPAPAATTTTPTPTPLRQQPPLLPLPMKSATKKISVPPSAISRSSSTAARQNNQIKRKKKKQQQQQSKPSTNPKKEPAAELEAAKIEGAPKPMENKPTIFLAKKEEEETGEEFLIGPPAASKSVSSVYSLSPPPSSLPLPRLLLMRPRRSAKVAPVASSCNIAEAVAGADAGAADDLRKLLRL